MRIFKRCDYEGKIILRCRCVLLKLCRLLNGVIHKMQQSTPNLRVSRRAYNTVTDYSPGSRSVFAGHLDRSPAAEKWTNGGEAHGEVRDSAL